MSFFSSREPTPVQQAVERATDELLMHADWNANLEVVEMVSTAEVVDEILSALHQRLLPSSPFPLLVPHPTAVPHVQSLALTLLQTCMANGGDHASVSFPRATCHSSHPPGTCVCQDPPAPERRAIVHIHSGVVHTSLIRTAYANGMLMLLHTESIREHTSLIRSVL